MPAEKEAKRSRVRSRIFVAAFVTVPMVILVVGWLIAIARLLPSAP